MPRLHHTQQKAYLRRLLDAYGALEEFQAWDFGVNEDGFRQPGLYLVTRTVRPRVTQDHEGSEYELTFVTRDPAIAQWSGSQLGHLAGAAETVRRSGVTGTARRPLAEGRFRMPDLEVLSGEGEEMFDHALEYDAGYKQKDVREKLRDFTAGLHYPSVIWGTSVRGRVGRIAGWIEDEQRKGQLPGLKRAQVLYAPYWTEKETKFQHSARPSGVTLTF